jgi:mono/diheme cytochrome c family protein
MKILASAIATLALLGAALFAFMYSGLYDLSAVDPHLSPVRWAIEIGKRRSIERYADGITAPPLDDEAMLRKGAAIYAEKCTSCHDSPGSIRPLAALRMRPSPPPIAEAAERQRPGESFWVIKHGIKATGMPSWGPSLSDDDIWAVVAFIDAVPGLSAWRYHALLLEAGVDGRNVARVAATQDMQESAGAAKTALCEPVEPEVPPLTLSVGEAVRWTNDSGKPRVVVLYPQAATVPRKELEPELTAGIRSHPFDGGAGFRYSFASPGRYLYACGPQHGGSWLAGTILVEPTPGPAH